MQVTPLWLSVHKLMDDDTRRLAERVQRLERAVAVLARNTRRLEAEIAVPYCAIENALVDLEETVENDFLRAKAALDAVGREL